MCCAPQRAHQQRASTSGTPSKPRQVSARALSFPVQPSTLGTSSTYTAGSQVEAAASCPWPKPPTWVEASSQPGGGVWAMLSTSKVRQRVLAGWREGAWWWGLPPTT